MRITLVHLLPLILVVKVQCLLTPRADQNEENTTCSGNIAASVFTRFTGIFFGDFTSTGGQDILGPLAVQGSFTANSYTVNSNHGTGSCSDPTVDMSTYGLVVGGKFIGSDVHIHGSAFLPGGTDTNQVEMLDSNCEAYAGEGTGLFDFNQAYQNAAYLQKLYAGVSPTMKLNSDSTLTKLSDPVLDFDIFTFNTCLDGCSVNADALSDPDAFLLGKGNWNGVSGSSFPKNVPVTVGSTITLINNQPIAGIDPCRAIWNFYPVDSEGNYSPEKIEINRQTAGQLGGFILAPEADIVDGSTGNFAGLTVAHDYVWQGAGVEMHDYHAIGGDCDGLLPCIPIYNNTPPDDPNHPHNPPSSSFSSSSTTSSTSLETDSSSDSTNNESSPPVTDSDSSSTPSTGSDSDSTPPVDSGSESTPPTASESHSTPPTDFDSVCTPSPTDSSNESIPTTDSDSSPTPYLLSSDSESTPHTDSICTPKPNVSESKSTSQSGFESLCTKHTFPSKSYSESTLSSAHSTIISSSVCSVSTSSAGIQNWHDSEPIGGYHEKTPSTQDQHSYHPPFHHPNDKNGKNKHKHDDLGYKWEWNNVRNSHFKKGNGNIDDNDCENHKHYHENDDDENSSKKKQNHYENSKHDKSRKKANDNVNKGHGNGEYGDGDKMKEKYHGQNYQGLDSNIARQDQATICESPTSTNVVDTPIADQVPEAPTSKVTSNTASKSTSSNTVTHNQAKTTNKGSINGLDDLKTLLLVFLISIFSTLIF